jgi:hypothetical protein
LRCSKSAGLTTAIAAAQPGHDRPGCDVLKVYIGHYNRQRPHRALQLQAPEQEELERMPPSVAETVRRRDRLGGLLHEYYSAA